MCALVTVVQTCALPISKLMAMTPDELGALPGVSTSRAHQIVPGALVAEAVMDIFDLSALEICPWALREGVILERFDQISVLDEGSISSAERRVGKECVRTVRSRWPPTP